MTTIPRVRTSNFADIFQPPPYISPISLPDAWQSPRRSKTHLFPASSSPRERSCGGSTISPLSVFPVPTLRRFVLSNPSARVPHPFSFAPPAPIWRGMWVLVSYLHLQSKRYP